MGFESIDPAWEGHNWKGFESIDPAWETSSRGRGRRGRSAPPQQQAPQQPAPQPSPQQQNTGYQDVSRRSLAPPIPIQGVGPALPSGTQFARGGPVRGTGYAEGGSVDDNARRTNDDDTVYASTAPAWTKGSYASALGLAGGAGQGYAQGGPVEPAGTNFRRILAHNRRKFGLHEQQQRTGYAEGGEVQDLVYDPNRDYVEPEQPVYGPDRDRVAATPADDRVTADSDIGDLLSKAGKKFWDTRAGRENSPDIRSGPEIYETLKEKAAESPDIRSLPEAYGGLKKSLAGYAQGDSAPPPDAPPTVANRPLTAESGLGSLVAGAGKKFWDTRAGIGDSPDIKSGPEIGQKILGSAKQWLADYISGKGALPPEHTEQLIREKEAANPNASHNDNLQSVFDDFMSQYKHDDAGKFIQSLRQPYDQARAVSQAALAHDNIDASLKAFEHAHNLLPNETNLQLERQPDGMIRATVAERGGDAQTKLLTPQQYSDWIHSSGSQFDHVGDIGTGRSLGKATGPDGDTHTNRVAQGLEGVKNEGRRPYATEGVPPPGYEGGARIGGQWYKPAEGPVHDGIVYPPGKVPYPAPHLGDARSDEKPYTPQEIAAQVRAGYRSPQSAEQYNQFNAERIAHPDRDPLLLGSTPEDWRRALDAIGGPDTRTGLVSITDEGGREVSQEAGSRSEKVTKGGSESHSSGSKAYRDRPPSYFQTPLGRSPSGGETDYDPPRSAPRAGRAPTRTYIGPQGEERTGPNRAVVPRGGRRSELDDDTGAPAPSTGYAGTDVDDTQTLPPEIANARAEVPATTGYNQPLPPPSGRPFTPNFNEGMNAPGSAAPAPFQAGPNDPLYNQPPSWPRPDQHGRASYPGGLRMNPTTDPRQQVLQGPNGETIAGFPANQSMSAEDVAAKYQSYNQRELEKRLYDGDPVAVAALTRRGPQDFSKPLPPPQPATPESMAAAKAEMVKRQMIRPDPPSEFEQRLARETNPATRTALINQQGLNARNEATLRQHAQQQAELQLSKREQNLMQNYRSNQSTGMPHSPEELAVAKKLGELTLAAMNQRGGQPAGAPPAQTTAGPVQVRTLEEARKLPRGTQFIGPDGVTRVVP